MSQFYSIVLFCGESGLVKLIFNILSRPKGGLLVDSWVLAEYSLSHSGDNDIYSFLLDEKKNVETKLFYRNFYSLSG